MENVEFIKVNRLKTKLSIENNKKLPIYIIQVSLKTDTKQLYKIKNLNNIVIKWETLNKIKDNHAMQKMSKIRTCNTKLQYDI